METKKRVYLLISHVDRELRNYELFTSRGKAIQRSYTLMSAACKKADMYDLYLMALASESQSPDSMIRLISKDMPDDELEGWNNYLDMDIYIKDITDQLTNLK